MICMKFRVFVCWILLFAVPIFAKMDVSAFQAYVDATVPGSRYGLSIRSVKTGEELANIRGGEKFTPASTMKTLSTATAVYYLPLDYAPQTLVAMHGSVKSKVFWGDIVVRGEGDPNFSARFYPNTLYKIYEMADSIRALGVDTIRGRVTLDTSYYTGPWRPNDWKPHYFNACYGAEITPLEYNDNCALIQFKPSDKDGDSAIVKIIPDVGHIKVINNVKTVKNDPVKVGKGKPRKRKLTWEYALDPKEPIVTIKGEIDLEGDSIQFVIPVRHALQFFKAAFIKGLKNRGLVFEENDSVPAGLNVKEFTFSAAPLLSIITEINQKSQNLHAETLFRNMAAQTTGTGSVEAGWQMEEKFLKEIGVKPEGFEVYDGCGLSSKNKIKPSAETQMLAAMARHSKGQFYIKSFASPGVGSGSSRMAALQYPWLTHFKTGYISNVHGLAGYVYTMDGDTLALAMYLNDTGSNPDATCKNVMDSLWLRIINMANNNYGSLMEMKSLWLAAQNVRGLPARLEHFSKALMGKPYLLGPMGEGYLDTIETKPLVYMDSVDCVTYMEHALALALAPNEDSLYTTLQKIRYYDGKVSYRYRKHYMLLDWVGEGKFAKDVRMDGDTTIERTMQKKAFFAAKNISFAEKDPKVKINYLNMDKAIAWSSEPYKGDLKVMGIAYVSKSDKIDAYHTGFIVLKPGETPMFRHASQIKKQVIEQPLQEYLEENAKKKALGISLFEFINP